jgi:ParB family transcriptional regulator, chromosome partitioning protein
MNELPNIEGRDISVGLLKPLNERTIKLKTNAGFRKIVSSIKAIGLVEPLCVYQEGDHYVILDGFLRYKACEELEIDTIPCILYEDKQAYSYNKNVNRLSAFQEMRMLRKAVASIPEPEVASTFGMKSINYRLSPNLIKELHPAVVKAFKKDLLTRSTARELIYVKRERQAEIVGEMAAMSDYSMAFCRSLVIRTPVDQMNPRNKRERKAWADDGKRKKDIVANLEKAEKQYDFYRTLYRQYSTDLLKMTVYVRGVIMNPAAGDYLAEKHPQVLKQLRDVVLDGDSRGEAS